jgi:enoyl-CoA hydratase/carnithine racemase
MEYENILYEQDGKTVIITLNRPDTVNAISPELERELHLALDRADEDQSVRAIILTGKGRAFSAGYDLAGEGLSFDPAGKYTGEYLKGWWDENRGNIQKLMHIWYLGKPVIAAINGWCIGGGFWYSLVCDITLASDKAVFAQPEIRHTDNSTFLFATLAGWKAAHRYTLTGDHFDAEEALRLGVINEVVPHEELMPRAQKLADRIAMVPEASVRLNKAITCYGLEAMGLRGGMLMNGVLSTLVQCSHGPEREALLKKQAEGGFKAFLDARDGPFQPEPFGPRSTPNE